MRRTIAVILSFVCLPAANPAFAETTGDLKQQVVKIPAGTVIEVALQQKGSKKITGRLGPVSDEGFEVQTVTADRVTTAKVAFGDVKSVKEKRRMHWAVKTLIITGIVVGALMAIYFGGCSINPNSC